MDIADKDVHKGHRSRMRAKLASHGPRIFDTYELLEMLLYYVIPYKDTNPIAKRLLSAFGSLDGVLSAEPCELAAVDGIGQRCAEVIHAVGGIVAEDAAGGFGRRVDIFDDYNLAGEYMTRHLASTDAKICVALLDNGMRLIDIKDIPGSDFSSGAVKARYFIDAALSCGATVVIIAHEHEHGALFPSEGDMATDKLIRSELARLGIAVAEHYIVGGSRYVGLRLGLSIRVSDSMGGLERFYDSIPVMAGYSEIKICDGDLRASGGLCYDEQNPLERLLTSILGDEKKAVEASDALLGRYGRLATILSEDAEEISRVGGISLSTALFIKLIGYLHSRRITETFKTGRAYSTREISEYVKALYVGLSKESVYILSFDSANRFLSCDLVGEGTVSTSDVYPRRLIETAIRAKAKSVILSHNHPMGAVTPSKEDTYSMRRFADLFNSAGIRLAAHYIVADGEIGGFTDCEVGC